MNFSRLSLDWTQLLASSSEFSQFFSLFSKRLVRIFYKIFLSIFSLEREEVRESVRENCSWKPAIFPWKWENRVFSTRAFIHFRFLPIFFGGGLKNVKTKNLGTKIKTFTWAFTTTIMKNKPYQQEQTRKEKKIV